MRVFDKQKKKIEMTAIGTFLLIKKKLVKYPEANVKLKQKLFVKLI